MLSLTMYMGVVVAVTGVGHTLVILAVSGAKAVEGGQRRTDHAPQHPYFAVRCYAVIPQLVREKGG